MEFNPTNLDSGTNYGRHYQGGTGTMTASVVKAPPETGSRISDGISATEQLLSGIHETIAALEKRLDIILHPVPPQAMSNDANRKNPTPVSSHLTGRIEILNEGLAGAVNKLNDVIRRIEV